MVAIVRMVKLPLCDGYDVDGDDKGDAEVVSGEV